MQQSFIQTWKSEGHAEGLAEGLILGMLEARRTDLLQVLKLRFQGMIPSDLVALIQNLNDLDQITQWFDSAVVAPSMELFRLMIRQQTLISLASSAAVELPSA